MRNIRIKPQFSLALLALSFASCRITPPAGSYTNLPPTGAPFVQLKNGQTVTGDVELKTPFIGRSRVEVNGKAYKPTDVSFFQDDKARYANVGRATFAPQVADGNIKLFRNITLYTSANMPSTGGMATGMTTHRQITDYMLPAGKKQVELFNYENLKKAIPSRDPAAAYFNDYMKQRRTGRIVTYAGLAAMVGGALLAANSASSGSGTGAAIGGGLFLLGGPTAIYTGIIINASKRKHLYRALDAYNGEEGNRSERRENKRRITRND